MCWSGPGFGERCCVLTEGLKLTCLPGCVASFSKSAQAAHAGPKSGSEMRQHHRNVAFWECVSFQCFGLFGFFPHQWWNDLLLPCADLDVVWLLFQNIFTGLTVNISIVPLIGENLFHALCESILLCCMILIFLLLFHLKSIQLDCAIMLNNRSSVSCLPLTWCLLRRGKHIWVCPLNLKYWFGNTLGYLRLCWPSFKLSDCWSCALRNIAVGCG